MQTPPRRPEPLDRRGFLGRVAGASALALLGGGAPSAAVAQPTRPPRPDAILTRPIPSTGEAVPVVGMGTWITFNVGQDRALRNARTQVLADFFAYGGRMVDCSPMYGSSADVLGYALDRLDGGGDLFSASKVWTTWTGSGPDQMEEQRRRWGVAAFDLMQVHNLRNWQGHLETLRAQKAEGRLRYIGMTTSHGRRHDELIGILETVDGLDFIQVTYNILDRAVEDRILPLARERGIAVIANRPFRRKDLFRRFQDRPLPAWAPEEADARNWAEMFLKFIVSHPAVTCAIPATSQRGHMAENMGAAYGRLPDAATRARMAATVRDL
jgi:diketogulonate reductase-like aldo/keto reductase